MPNVAVFHGYDGDGDEHWIGKASQHFKAKRWNVYNPNLSNPLNPNRRQWVSEMNAAPFEYDAETASIYHSLANCAGFHQQLETRCQLAGAFWVAATAEDVLELDEIDVAIRKSIDPDMYLIEDDEKSDPPEKVDLISKISSLARLHPHHLYHGSDDKIVPDKYPKRILDALGIPIDKQNWYATGGHLHGNTPGNVLQQFQDKLIADVEGLFK